jgi:hypothetical protein
MRFVSWLIEKITAGREDIWSALEGLEEPEPEWTVLYTNNGSRTMYQVLHKEQSKWKVWGLPQYSLLWANQLIERSKGPQCISTAKTAKK